MCISFLGETSTIGKDNHQRYALQDSVCWGIVERSQILKSFVTCTRLKPDESEELLLSRLWYVTRMKDSHHEKLLSEYTRPDKKMMADAHARVKVKVGTNTIHGIRVHLKPEIKAYFHWNHCIILVTKVASSSFDDESGSGSTCMGLPKVFKGSYFALILERRL